MHAYNEHQLTEHGKTHKVKSEKVLLTTYCDTFKYEH